MLGAATIALVILMALLTYVAFRKFSVVRQDETVRSAPLVESDLVVAGFYVLTVPDLDVAGLGSMILTLVTTTRTETGGPSLGFQFPLSCRNS